MLAIAKGARWTWNQIPHPHNDLLHRLSEVGMALKEQTSVLRSIESEQRAQTSVIDERSCSLRDTLNRAFLSSTPPVDVKAQESKAQFHKDMLAIQANQIAALDVIAKRQKEIGDYIQLFCRTLTGGEAGGYKDMTDEEQLIQEKAIMIERRYKVSHEEALKRARQMQAYEPTGQMGDNV
jgi:hypothetical protein